MCDTIVLASESAGSCKLHGSGMLAEAEASYGSDSWSVVGEPVVSTGFLGLGKIMSSNSSGSSDWLILGDSSSSG